MGRRGLMAGLDDASMELCENGTIRSWSAVKGGALLFNAVKGG
jgi:hypothetical protein